MLATLLQAETHTVVFDMRYSLLGWLIIGLIAGWLAGQLFRGRGFGCITDIVLGLIGSVLGGWIFVKLGIFGGGLIYSLAAATVGAVILVAIAHLFSGGDR
ncbi:MAG TPA: GlsB/YeaQ/YmgE family stress response membrane protein [Candidatus Acidoferrum sp.]|jgi:uncharacterized membrane protein YeaQ/YmgE (transglycosylase-associated protein family)